MSNSDQTNVLSVSKLSYLIRRALENHVGHVWVEGEISSATQAQSGHVYLTLKDAKAQIRGIIWRSTLERLNIEIEPGQKVLCRGAVEVYPPRGEYQIVIDRVEQTGQGALQVAFRKLHQRLQKEGLFDPSFKKALPTLPGHLAVVTSPSGAAIFDFLKVLLRRWPRIRVTIIPVAVQGHDAKIEIAQAILAANRLQEKPDALVVTRGGGSLEDLWAFNEEVVVRAIFESTIPVMSAVGHEVDVTLSDLAADQRAATPSEAAEKLVPDFRSLKRIVDESRIRLASGLQNIARLHREKLDRLASHPVFAKPMEGVQLRSRQLDELDQRMKRFLQQKLVFEKNALASLTRGLEAVSPLQVLSRGYSITQDENGDAIQDVRTLQSGQSIHSTLESGTIESRVTKVIPADLE